MNRERWDEKEGGRRNYDTNFRLTASLVQDRMVRCDILSTPWLKSYVSVHRFKLVVELLCGFLAAFRDALAYRDRAVITPLLGW